MDLFLTNMQFFTSQYVNWWTGVVWIIVMFLSSVWTLILTAPIHWWASDAIPNCVKHLSLCISLSTIPMLETSNSIYFQQSAWSFLSDYSFMHGFWIWEILKMVKQNPQQKANSFLKAKKQKQMSHGAKMTWISIWTFLLLDYSWTN